MPATTAPQERPHLAVLTAWEREVLYALGCRLENAEIADALALSEYAVTGNLGRILVKLGLPDRAAAIVHAFDCGLVVPGRGPCGPALSSAPQITVRQLAGSAPRRTGAPAVFDRAGRRLADDLGMAPGELLRRARQAVLPAADLGPRISRAGAA